MWRSGKVTSSCSLVTSVMLLSEGRTLEVRKAITDVTREHELVTFPDLQSSTL
jgi:hypothetical protein